VFVVLPLATISRILDKVSDPPYQASEYRLGADSPESRRARPALATHIVTALTRAKADPHNWIERTDKDGKTDRTGKDVGPLPQEDFATLSVWCRDPAVNLPTDADTVDAAVRDARE
jgi:hypothetical protein